MPAARHLPFNAQTDAMEQKWSDDALIEHLVDYIRNVTGSSPQEADAELATFLRMKAQVENGTFEDA